MILVLSFFLTISAKAGIICPDDISYTCDIYNQGLSDYPGATATGNDAFLSMKFHDEEHLNHCHIGNVLRTWFIDRNGNNELDAEEPYCVQTITLNNPHDQISISYPDNLTLSCVDDLTEFGSPQVGSGPCDLIGISYTDEIFDVVDNACYKILRHYTICNYCIYQDDNPDSEGIWQHTQVIKVIDEDAPIIEDCGDSTISTADNCTAEVRLSKSATDIGNCFSDQLTWQVSVDVGVDGIIDYKYGINEEEPFKIDKQDIGEEIEIELPERLTPGYVEVIWTVSDGCGNHAVCKEKITIKDLKPPTPYCHIPLYFTLDGRGGDSLVIPARIYNKDGYDNCSGDLRFSYSKDINDTLKVVKCGQTGVQLDRIYVTDMAGNQEFCTVYSFIFDNGSCNFSYAPQGKVNVYNEEVLPEVSAVFSNGDLYQEVDVRDDGSFTFSEMPMKEDLKASLIVDEQGEADFGLRDLKLLSNHLLGIEILTDISLISADVNGDKMVDFNDLLLMKNHLLGVDILEKSWRVIPENKTHLSSEDFIPYTSYDGDFNFTLVSKGNLSTALPNDSSIIKISVEEEDGRFNFYNAQRFETQAILLNYTTGSDQEVKIDNYSEQPILDLSSNVIAAKELLWSLSAESLADAKNKFQLEILDDHNVPYEIRYVNIKDNDKPDSTQSLEVFPSIFSESFIINQPIDEVELYDVNGQFISFETVVLDSQVEFFPHYNQGILFVKINIDNRIITKKVVKL